MSLMQELLSCSELLYPVQSLSKDWRTCHRTAMSLKQSFVRDVCKAEGSRLRQKLVPSGFCHTAEVLLVRSNSCC